MVRSAQLRRNARNYVVVQCTARHCVALRRTVVARCAQLRRAVVALTVDVVTSTITYMLWEQTVDSEDSKYRCVVKISF